MLREILKYKRYRFTDGFDSWQDAVRESCRSLKEEGILTDSYAEEVIANVNRYGAYFVIAPEIALIHSTEFAEGVSGTAISYMHLNRKINLMDDPEKSVSVMLTICSDDPAKHMKNIALIASELGEEQVCEDLRHAKSPDDLERLMNRIHEMGLDSTADMNAGLADA
ncbi:MAG: PTS sugar transporter subunit IIA [Solobacterium sp.]|nr:PTS sugar transporter subunit IIA [Solobacterium sp.]